MKTHFVRIRSSILSSKMFNYHISRFFKITKFDSNYILIRVDLITDSKVHILGNEYILDVTKENELNSYKLFLKYHYQQDFLKKDQSNISKIVFKYIETNKQEYEKNVFKLFRSTLDQVV